MVTKLPSLPVCPFFTVRPMRWMRRRGDRVIVTTGKYAGQTGTVESNVHQRTVDFPGELANGYHVMLDSGELVPDVLLRQV